MNSRLHRVENIVGIRYGYKGLTKASKHEPIADSAVVDQVQTGEPFLDVTGQSGSRGHGR